MVCVSPPRAAPVLTARVVGMPRLYQEQQLANLLLSSVLPLPGNRRNHLLAGHP